MLLILNGQIVESSPTGVVPLSVASFSVNSPAPVAVPSAPAPTLAKVVAECLAAKRTANRRAEYLRSLKYYLNRFIRGRETQPVSSITRVDIETWLATFGDPSTRQSWLNRLQTFFAYAVDREIIDRNPCEKVLRVTVDRKTPKILTNGQAETLLRHVATQKQSQLAFFVLGLLAGVRPFEIMRLTWDDVNFDAAQVTVSATASKVRQRRVVPLQPAAVQWLRVAKDSNALLPLSPATAKRYNRQWAAVLGFKTWHPDLLRHTAASQTLALTGDLGRTATSLGTSPSMLHRHYLGITQPGDAAKFWAILPEQPTQK